ERHPANEAATPGTASAQEAGPTSATVPATTASDSAPSDEASAPSLAANPVAALSHAATGGMSTVDAESLDAGFAILTPIQLGYPDAALRARKTGQVRLEVEVGPDGRVLNVRVLESTPGWGFEESARNAYAQARFSPPRWQGRPVRVL